LACRRRSSSRLGAEPRQHDPRTAYAKPGAPQSLRQSRAGSLWPLARWLTLDVAIIERAPSSDNASLEHRHSRSEAWIPRGEPARAERTHAGCHR
jgi:hypothetical protein